jgi:small conductance mechanosensitive channel
MLINDIFTQTSLNAGKAFQLLNSKVDGWIRHFVILIPNMLLAAIVLVCGILVSRWIRNLAEGIFRKITPNGVLVNLFSSTIYILTLGLTIFSVLDILELDKTVTSILAGAGIMTLALAFAFQDIAANVISGIFISFRRPLNIGDIVKIKDYMGLVTGINLRDTVIRTFQGQLVIMPNKDVFQSAIENYSMLGKRRLDLRVGISYSEDLELVKKVTLEAVERIKGLSKDDKTTMFYEEFSDSSIRYVLRIWVASVEQPDYLEVGSQAIMRIMEAYRKNHISIPFPIRTLDFGGKEGFKFECPPLSVQPMGKSGMLP